MKVKNFKLIYLNTCLYLFSNLLFAQINVTQREFLIHNRGMLHETVYNTGEIAQSWTPSINYKVTVPMMEWPSNSRTVIDAIEYNGQMNCFGGGIQITANFKGTSGTTEDKGRLGAFCGGVGSGTKTEPPFGIWSFPVSSQLIENYPILPDGSLNPNFNPNEAEQIIIQKWNTSAGIGVTRVSRAYSYPDYDDFIIYEYTLENNGIFYDNVENKLKQIDTTLVDVMVTFIYGISPSMLGSSRLNPEHTWDVHYKMNYPASYWDPDYWLLYNQITAVGGDTLLGGRPEPFLNTFKEFATTGKNGGGLLSPQAAGFSILYYDTEHLSIIDTTNSARNQSPQFVALNLFKRKSGVPLDLGPDGKIKQPYKSFVGNDANARNKTWETINNFALRNGSFYDGTDNWLPSIYIGRFIPLDLGNYVWSTRTLSFGPYYLKPKDKIKFAIAEMVGYGADPNKLVVGGPKLLEGKHWTKGVFWDRPVKVENQIVTQNYVQDYGIPDYVNSKVVYINDVAHKAAEAYLGKNLPKPDKWSYDPPPFWPENNPKDGSYRVPIPIPAPVIEAVNTDTGTVVIKWKRFVEDFEKKYPEFVTGHLRKFNVYRADYKMGPWKLLGSVNIGQVNEDDEYEFIDSDRSFKVGETKYYSVVSVDEFENMSGKTNIISHKKNIGPASELKNVYVVPNPFVIKSGFQGLGAERMLGIYGLPAECTIHIYSFSGQRLWTIEHHAQSYSDNWEQITRNDQDIASGVYFFVVTTPSGEKTMGKFLVIK